MSSREAPCGSRNTGCGWPRLGSPAGRRQAAYGLVHGVGYGVVLGFGYGVGYGVVLGLGFGVGYAVALGLGYGLALGLGFGLVVQPEVSRAGGTVSPRSVVRDDLVFGIAVGLAVGTAAWLALGLGHGLQLGLTVGLGVGFVVGGAGVRYLVFLVCVRRWWSDRWLPWRLGRFLDWCCQAGLMRAAGVAYQFRHRELQDFLVRPTPSLTARGETSGVPNRLS